jgi:hypothetical protein
MPLSITYDELLRYTAGEREKWRRWFLEHSSAIDAPCSPAAESRTSAS